MHIPDGYLSPHTSGIFYIVSAPLWWLSLRSMQRRLRQRHVPLLAILAAFSFLVMMFNIPLPGGTTGHAVGGVLIAILVGPWPAMIAVTLALGIQALLFGDGGILTLGANAFNLGFVMPITGYLAFRAVAGGSAPPSRRFIAAAAIGGYLGLNVAALAVALELGMQPGLHHLPDGTPLYCPFTTAVTVPAMMIPHLTVGGVAEALLTGGVVAFLGRYHPESFSGDPPYTAAMPEPEGGRRETAGASGPERNVGNGDRASEGSGREK